MTINIFWVGKWTQGKSKKFILGRFLPFIPILTLLLFLHPFPFLPFAVKRPLSSSQAICGALSHPPQTHFCRINTALKRRCLVSANVILFLLNKIWKLKLYVKTFKTVYFGDVLYTQNSFFVSLAGNRGRQYFFKNFMHCESENSSVSDMLCLAINSNLTIFKCKH